MTRRISISVLLCCCTLSMVAQTPLPDLCQAKVSCYSTAVAPLLSDTDCKAHLLCGSTGSPYVRSSRMPSCSYIGRHRKNNDAIYTGAGEMLPLSPLCTLNGKNNAQLSGTIAEAEVPLVVVKDRTRKQARQRISGMHVKERKFAIGKKGVQSKGVKFRFTNHLYKKGIISNADSDADQEAEHQA